MVPRTVLTNRPLRRSAAGPAPSTTIARRASALTLATAMLGGLLGVILPALGAAPASAAVGDIYTIAGGTGPSGVLGTKLAVRPARVLATATGALFSDGSSMGIRRLTMPAATVTMFAGNGAVAVGADGPVATNSELWWPDDVVTDSSGNVYVSDTLSRRIRKITPAGAISTIAGTGAYGGTGDGGPATAATFKKPEGLAVGSDGTIYVADSGDHRVRQIVPGGTILPFAGSGIEGYSGDGNFPTLAQLDEPTDVETGIGNVVYIADAGSSTIRRVEGSAMSTVAGTGTAGFSGDGGIAKTAMLRHPNAIDYSGGVLYVADTDNTRIRTVAGGIIGTWAGGGDGGNGSPRLSADLNFPTGVSRAADGTVYVATLFDGLHRVAPDGTVTRVVGNGELGQSGDGGQATQAQIHGPSGIAHDNAGNTYIAELFGNAVRRRSSTGLMTTYAGGGSEEDETDDPLKAHIDAPSDVDVDAAGNVYIAEFSGARIRKITPSGHVSVVAGTGVQGYGGDGGPAILAKINQPRGIDVLADGSILIADTYNDRVRKVLPDGTMTTLAGTGVGGFSGDGGPATAAKLDGPHSVVDDGRGGVLVTDEENHRIRRISGGVITTVAGNGTTSFNGDNGSPKVAGLYRPRGIAVDEAGAVFVGTDSRVRRITADLSVITTVAGNGLAGYSGDAGSATKARMGTPDDLLIEPWGDLVLADSGGQRVRRVIAVASPGSGYHPLTPARILDSRENIGGYATKWPAATSRDVQVTGVGGVPATGATSVVLNVTVTGGSAASHLTVYPAGQSMPTASNLNWPAGDTRPNLVTAKVGAGGKVSIFNNSGTVHVIADVVGWYDNGLLKIPGDRFTPLTPARILDSRENIGGFATVWGPGTSRDVKVRGVGGVPDTATAVVLNVTVTGTTAASHLTVWPQGEAKPVASNLNWPAGDTRPNLVVAKVSTYGKVSIFNNSGQAHVIADVVGYFSPEGQAFHGSAPFRLLDSRENIGGYSTPWGPVASRSVKVAGVGPVPASAKAVVLNVTVTGATAASHLTVWPFGVNKPTASNLNWSAGQTVPNLVVVKVGTDGKVGVYNNSGQAHVIADVVGWYL